MKATLSKARALCVMIGFITEASKALDVLPAQLSDDKGTVCRCSPFSEKGTSPVPTTMRTHTIVFIASEQVVPPKVLSKHIAPSGMSTELSGDYPKSWHGEPYRSTQDDAGSARRCCTIQYLDTLAPLAPSNSSNT